MLISYFHVLLKELMGYAYLIPNAADDLYAPYSQQHQTLKFVQTFELVLVRSTFRFLTTEGC